MISMKLNQIGITPSFGKSKGGKMLRSRISGNAKAKLRESPKTNVRGRNIKPR